MDNAIFNPSTSFGAGKDTNHSVFSATNIPLLSYDQLRAVYRHTALARKAVDRPVRDVMSRPNRIDINGKDVSNEPLWVSESKRLDARASIMRAAQWARAFGAARIVLDVDDGLDFEQPLGSFQRINQILVFDGFQLLPKAVYSAGADIQVGGISMFALQHPGQRLAGIISDKPSPKWQKLVTGGRVHASRVFTILGNDLHPMDVDFGRPEGDSVIQTFWRELCHRLDMSTSATVLASEARIDGVKSPSLEASSVGEGAERYQDRMEELTIGKSVLNMLLLKGDEEYFSRQMQLNGMADLSKIVNQAWCAASEIPASIFFEEASSGMSGSDNPDASTYADMKNSLWSQKIAPAWEWLAEQVLSQRKVFRKAAKVRSVSATLETAQTEAPKDTVARLFMQTQILTMAIGAKLIPPSYGATMFQGPNGLTFNLPTYEEGRFPWPVVDPEAAKGGGGGANAPGQVPVNQAEKPTGGSEALFGVDPRNNATNTGVENKL